MELQSSVGLAAHAVNATSTSSRAPVSLSGARASRFDVLKFADLRSEEMDRAAAPNTNRPIGAAVHTAMAIQKLSVPFKLVVQMGMLG